MRGSWWGQVPRPPVLATDQPWTIRTGGLVSLLRPQQFCVFQKFHRSPKTVQCRPVCREHTVCASAVRWGH